MEGVSMCENAREKLETDLASLLDLLGEFNLRPPGTVEEWMEFGDRCYRMEGEDLMRLMALLFPVLNRPNEEEGEEEGEETE